MIPPDAAASLRVLLVTQKADVQDPVLGFFHQWAVEFAKHFSAIVLICLQEGTHHFPGNVRVLSLGKEKQVGRWGYVRNFFTYIWKERHNYDVVFVHMNQEYVLLGGLVWKILGKKVVLWRNHPDGTVLTRIAVWLADEVCCTSPQSFTARFAKTRIMPVGVDTDVYAPEEAIRLPGTVLCLGRISAVKRVDVLISALQNLEAEGVELKATIVGSALSKADEAYEQKLHAQASGLVQKGVVTFVQGVAPENAINYFRRNDLFVNMTPEGSFDKTIIEAMACGAIVVCSNKGALAGLNQGTISNITFKAGDADGLAEKLKMLLNVTADEKQKLRDELRQFAVSRHSLAQLGIMVRELY